jgi:DNA-binding transcriptional MocR family regulator
MPSEHQLRDRYGINRSVARQAYDLLESEGLCVIRRGMGRFVTAVPQTAVITLQPGDSVRSRMPAEAERAGLGIAQGVPLLEITRADGRTEAYSAAAAAAVCQCPGRPPASPLCPGLA